MKIQNLLPRIENLMKSGKTWSEIASEIGWEKRTLRIHWKRHIENLSEQEREDLKVRCGFGKPDFEKMWNTLKAESGYRKTISSFAETLGRDDLNSTLNELMESIEKRAKEQDLAST